MVAHRRAARGGRWNFDGAHCLWIRRAKTMVASSRDRDVRLDYSFRIDPWRVEPDSSSDHVARDHQRFGVWWRGRLVLLFQTKRGRVFLRAGEPMT